MTRRSASNRARPRGDSRRRARGLLGGLIVASLTLASGCAAQSTESGDTVTLVFADNFSATNPVGKGGVAPFLDYVNEHGPDVGLDINYYGPGQLGKRTDAPTLLRSGAIDISPITPAYLVNELPLSTVSDLPGMAEDPCRTAEILLPMIKPGGSIYEEELKSRGIRPLWSVIIADYEVYTNDIQVTTPKDMGGRLIRSPGGVIDRALDGLGTASVQIGVTDLYEAVARKTVAGAVLPRYAVPTYSLEEVLRYGTEGADIGANTVFLAINPEIWDKLNDGQKKVLDDASAIAQRQVCTSVAEATDKSSEALRAAGLQITTIDGADKAVWEKAMEPLRQEWVEALESKGLPAGAVLDQLEDRLERNAE